MIGLGYLLLALLVPFAILIGALLIIKWWHARDGRRSPLTERLFHQPGEGLRKHVAKLDEDITEKFVRILFIGPLSLLAIALPLVDWSKFRFGWGVIIVVLFLSAFFLWNLYGLKRNLQERDQYRQGLAGEMMTAQQLAPLMAEGCLLFNDIPADKFNIDHVVVGPYSVYMVETKSRRKPPGKGKKTAEVVYDGKGLRFPDFAETSPIEQARATARWLANHLRGAAGEPVPVQAVVALPGWYVQYGKDAKASDVRVINPKMHGVFFDKRATPISESLRTRLAHALAKMYSEVE